MIKKGFIVIFSLFFLFSYNSVSAMESSVNKEGENSIARFSEEVDSPTEEEYLTEVSPFVTFGLGHASLGINKFIKSKYAYNLSKNEKIKIKNVSWSPTRQKIQLGFVHASTGKQYWTSSFTGGSKTGGTFSLGGSSGQYYIAIRTPSTNTRNVNVKGSFEF